MTSQNRFCPLDIIVKSYLKFHEKTSLRTFLLGKDPSQTPRFLQKHETYMFNRSTLVDTYAIMWLIIDLSILVLLGKLRGHPIWASVLAVLGFYRLHDIWGNILHVFLHRSQHDYVSERKLALTFGVYVEPILVFAFLHSALEIVLKAWSSSEEIYALGGRTWNWITSLHFSTACYTTVGWGDVSAKHPLAMILSSIESVMGILMLAMTISVFVSRSLNTIQKDS